MHVYITWRYDGKWVLLLPLTSLTQKVWTNLGKTEWCICFLGYINDKDYIIGRRWPPGEKKAEQSQYIKFCLLRSVCDYMSIIFVYQSSLSNGSLLICILVKKTLLLNPFTFIFLRLLWGVRLWGYEGGCWQQNHVNLKVLTEKPFIQPCR